MNGSPNESAHPGRLSPTTAARQSEFSMTISRNEAAYNGAGRHNGRAPVPDALADVAHIDARSAAAAAAISVSHFLDIVRKGEAPQPLRFGPRCTRWRLADIREWLRHRAEQGAADVASATFVRRRAKRASDAAQAKRRAVLTP